MKSHLKIALVLLAVGMVATGAWRFLEPYLADKNQAAATDASAKKGTISIGVDGWVGYFPLCSPELKKRLYRLGYGLKCVDDAADYPQRFARLADNDYQFAVATVDSYLLNGEQTDYPGPIVAVIDESKGGDAIIALKDKIASLDELKTAAGFRIAFTPGSPSHHLLKAVSAHFDIPALREPQRQIETPGSEAALKKLLDGEVEVAIVWEPEVTRGLEDKRVVRLLGTEDTRQLIVDILIASQDTVRKDPQLVKLLLKEYFLTLKFYREHPDELLDDIENHYSVKRDQAQALLKGVQWATLTQNVETWFGSPDVGYADETLLLSIESAVEILLDNKDFQRSPIPDEDPYRLINRQFVVDLNRLLMNGGGFTTDKPASSATTGAFPVLTEYQWDQLQPVGSLKTHNIVFVSGTSEITREGKQQIDRQMADLAHYPNFRVEIRGHTGLRGDPQANQKLSLQRAQAVLDYIESTHGIEKNRARAVGLGSSSPLQKRAGESNRSYHYRLPRVEIELMRETI